MLTIEHYLCISTAKVENLCHFKGIGIFDNLVTHRLNATRWNLACVFVSSCQSNQLPQSSFSNDFDLFSLRIQSSLFYLLAHI